MIIPSIVILIVKMRITSNYCNININKKLKCLNLEVNKHFIIRIINKYERNNKKINFQIVAG